MKLGKISIVAAVLLAVSLVSNAQAQSPLKRLEQLLDGNDEPAAAPSEPQTAPLPPPPDGATPPAPEPAREPGYLGLVGDDQGENDRGVRVISIRGGGPAQQAGLLPGDLITAIGGTPVASLQQMGALVKKLAAGEKAQLTIQRGGRQLTQVVVLGERPAAGAPAAELPAPAPLQAPPPPDYRSPLAPAGRPILGVRVNDVTDAAILRYGLVVRRGAVIESIRRDSPADRAGLPLGGAIIAVDGRRIDTAGQLVTAIASKRSGQKVEITYYQRDQLSRKTVTLTPAAAVARQEREPNLLLRPDPDDRAIGGPPALRRIERAIESITNRNIDLTIGGARTPREQALGQQVQSLQAQVQELQQRVTQLERLLKATENKQPPEPAKPNGGVERR